MIKYNLKKSNKSIYIYLTLVIVLLCTLMYYTFALFEFSTEKYSALNIKVGELDYKITGNGLVNNSIIIPANSTKYLELSLLSNNNIDTKYVLSYYCNNCENLKMYNSVTSSKKVSDVILKNDVNNINLVAENLSDNDYEITFNVDAVYFYNNLDTVSNIVDTYSSQNITISILDPNIEQEVIISEIIDTNNNAKIFYNTNVGYSVENLECTTTNEYYFDETFRKIIIKNVSEDLTCNIKFINNTTQLCNSIINTTENNIIYKLISDDNIIKSCENIDFSRVDSALYYNNSNLIFRGDTSNNYMMINNLLWRIVRINDDGSIKIVLNDVLDKTTFGSSEIITESKMYEFLNIWYDENLIMFDEIIVNDDFCYDKSNISNETFEYGSLIRIKNNSPSLSCDNEYKYYNKIGLLTTDEIMYAGAIDNSYLQTGQDIKWWTQSLQTRLTDIDYVYSYNELNGNFEGYSINEELSVKPVINILGSVHVTGTGTIEDPFIIN